MFEENVPNKKSLFKKEWIVYILPMRVEYCQVCIGKLVINEDDFIMCK